MLRHLTERWGKLSARERLVLTIGGGIVAAIMGFALVVDPWLEHLDRLDRQIARTHRHLQELGALGPEYTRSYARLATLEQRMAVGAGAFSLLPYLEDTAEAARVRDHITAMHPQTASPLQGYTETAVEMKLEQVAFPDVLDLLVKLEEAPALLQVKRLQIVPRFDSPQVLDATILVAAYEKA